MRGTTLVLLLILLYTIAFAGVLLAGPWLSTLPPLLSGSVGILAGVLAQLTFYYIWSRYL